MSAIDNEHWKRALERICSADCDNIVLVQTSIEWLHDVNTTLRESVDLTILNQLLARTRLHVRQVLPHDVSRRYSRDHADYEDMNHSYLGWSARLDAARQLTLTSPELQERLTIYRLIQSQETSELGLRDGLWAQTAGSWSNDFEGIETALRLMTESGAATPLDGSPMPSEPDEDIDPSLYF